MLRGLCTALKPPFGARCLASGNDMGLIKLVKNLYLFLYVIFLVIHLI